MARYTDEPTRERRKPSEGFASRWLTQKSREDEEISDWIQSTDGQIVLGLLGIVLLVAFVWKAFLGPLLSPLLGWIF